MFAGQPHTPAQHSEAGRAGHLSASLLHLGEHLLELIFLICLSRSFAIHTDVQDIHNRVYITTGGRSQALRMSFDLPHY